MELGELARRALPVNVMLAALLLFSAAGITLTNVDISPATRFIMYFSAGFLTLNFLIIYAVFKYRVASSETPTE